MKCDQGQDLLHTSLRCQYPNISERLVQMNTFSTAALCAAFLAPACSLCGAAARRLKLPQITGYLLAGARCSILPALPLYYAPVPTNLSLPKRTETPHLLRCRRGGGAIRAAAAR